jgi:hypothetical protein
MTAHIRTKRTVYEVYGKLQETAPILAWIAEQAPSARVKFDPDGDEQRVTQWFEFTVWFEEDTDEVNFKMFQSEAFEAGSDTGSEYKITASPFLFNTWAAPQSLSPLMNQSGAITGIITKNAIQPRGGK